MAAPFPGQMNAFQVGSYFVNNYYHMLQNRPDMVHQFYTNASTMVRLDVSTMVAANATGMLQIHGVMMNLNLNGIEVKSAQFLDSWNSGILVMVSGFVQLKEWSKRRRFIQSFFLAPQEKGYFVLNDMIHFLDEENDSQYQQPTGTEPHPVPQEPVMNYETGEELHEQEAVPVQGEETGTDTGIEQEDIEQEELVSSEAEPEIEEESLAQEPIDDPEPELPVLTEPEPVQEPEPVVSVPAQVTPVPEPVQVVSREIEPPVFVGEQPKLSYASILRAKQQVRHTLNPAPQKKPVSEPNPNIQSQTAPLLEKPIQEPFQDISIAEEEEAFSVYVGNLAPSTQVSDLEQEFRVFGPLKPDGIAIRSRKETGTFFAFIDFVDANGVQNAIQASPINMNGRLIYIDERKQGISRGGPSSRGAGRGRGGGRGTWGGGYNPEPSRRPFSGGRSFGDRDSDFANKSRGNGYPRRNVPAS